MAKFKKAAAAFVLAAVAAVSLMFVGCSGGSGAENMGTWHYSSVNPVNIEQGKLIRTTTETLTIYGDNTFQLSSVNDTMYSSDGVGYNGAFYGIVDVYGTYEVTYEDADLNEKTIKITAVNSIATPTDGTVEAANFTAEQSSAINSDIVGKEIILTSNHKLESGVDAITALQTLFGVE